MFVRFNANPVNKNTGDCTVRAISTVMNQSWRDTHADLAMTSYYLNEMPSSNSSWGEYLILNGYRRHVIPDTCPACNILQQGFQNGSINKQQYDLLMNQLQNGANPSMIIQQMLNSGMANQQMYESARQSAGAFKK